MGRQLVLYIVILLVVSSIVFATIDEQQKVDVIIKFKDLGILKKQVWDNLNSTEKLILQKYNVGQSRQKVLTQILQNKDIKLKRVYNLTNIVHATVSTELYGRIKNHPNVEWVEEDITLKLMLDDVNSMIGSNDFWSLPNLSINGTGHSVCVIDSGIDHTHEAFGSCNIINNSYYGNIINNSVESDHPYLDNEEKIFKINKAGFSNIAIHFVNISMEDEWDSIKILDPNNNNNTVAYYTGEHLDIWTPTVLGDTIFVKLDTDLNTVDWGFKIDQIINGSVNTTLNWSSCEKIIGGWDFTGITATYDKEDPFDDAGHGTHVSGIVASIDETFRGIAPGSKIVSVKAMNAQGTGNFTDVLAAVEFCIENKDRFNISTITMSLGLNGYSTNCDEYSVLFGLFSDLIDQANDNGIIVVAASGNDGYSDKIAFPACLENVTSVSSITKSDEIATGYANTASILDLLAPGSSINSAILGGGYSLKSGTSMAAPVIAGASILIKNFKENENGSILSPLQIKQILKSTGDNITDSRNFLTFKRVNLTRALDYIDESPRITLINGTLIGNITQNYTFINFSTSESLINATLMMDSESNIMNGSDKIFFYNILNLTDGIHNLSLTLFDYRYNSNIYSYVFNIDHNNPNVINITHTKILMNKFQINLSTNEDVNYTLFFGNESSNYLSNVSNESFSTNHLIYLSNLNLNQTYYYYVKIFDHVNNYFNSIEYNFTTDEPDLIAPSVNLTIPENNSFINKSFMIDLDFITSENSTCFYFINESINVTGLRNFSTNFSHFLNEQFNLSINCTDNSNNSVLYMYNITVDDTQMPVLSNMSITSSLSTITLQYETDEPSNATIKSQNYTLFNLSKKIILNSLNPGTTYYYNLTVCDKLKNCNITLISYQTLSQPSQPASSTSSSSSGGSKSSGTGSNITITQTNPTAQKIFSKLSIGSNYMKIDNIELALKKIILNINTNQDNQVLLKVELIKDPPKKLQGTYQYMSIETLAKNISNAQIDFIVNKTWIKNNSIDVNKVNLFRYLNNWTKLNTTLIKNDSEYFYYMSSTPGFSYFAITGQKINNKVENKISKDLDLRIVRNNDTDVKPNQTMNITSKEILTTIEFANSNAYLFIIMAIILVSYVFIKMHINKQKSN